MRIKEQETRLTLQEHDVDDDEEKELDIKLVIYKEKIVYSSL